MKRIPGFVIVTAACALLASGCIVATGCGGGSSTAGLTGLDLLQTARDNLEQANSFKMTVTVKDDSIGEEGSSEILGEPVDGDTTAEMVVEKTGDGETICMARIDGGDPVYITREGKYREVDGEWFFSAESPFFNGSDSFMSDPLSSLDPRNLMEMLDVEGEIETIEETDDILRFRLVPDQKEASPEELEEIAAFADIPRQELEAILEEIEQAYDEGILFIEATVEKEEGFISEVFISMEQDLTPYMKLLSIIFSEDPVETGTVYIDMEMTAYFSDYGKDFGLELPEETVKARGEWDNDMNSLVEDLLDSSSSAAGSDPGCQDNLRSINAAIMQYAAGNGGEYPTSLDQLVGDYLRNMPVCPDGGQYHLSGGDPPSAVCPNGHTY